MASRTAAPSAPTRSDLVLLYVTERRPLKALAAELGVGPAAARQMLVNNNIPVRSGHPALPLDHRTVADLYVRQRLSTREVASRLGCSQKAVRNHLVEHGIATRSSGARRHDAERREVAATIATTDLAIMYEAKGMTLQKLAGRLGIGKGAVRDLLNSRGIAIRHRHGLLPLRHDTLWQLYVAEGLSIREVARRLGCSPKSVTNHLARHGIPVRGR